MLFIEPNCYESADYVDQLSDPMEQRISCDDPTGLHIASCVVVNVLE